MQVTFTYADTTPVVVMESNTVADKYIYHVSYEWKEGISTYCIRPNGSKNEPWRMLLQDFYVWYSRSLALSHTIILCLVVKALNFYFLCPVVRDWIFLLAIHFTAGKNIKFKALCSYCMYWKFYTVLDPYDLQQLSQKCMLGHAAPLQLHPSYLLWPGYPNLLHLLTGQWKQYLHVQQH